MNCTCSNQYPPHSGREVYHFTTCPLWKPEWQRRAIQDRDKYGFVAVADKSGKAR